MAMHGANRSKPKKRIFNLGMVHNEVKWNGTKNDQLINIKRRTGAANRIVIKIDDAVMMKLKIKSISSVFYVSILAFYEFKMRLMTIHC